MKRDLYAEVFARIVAELEVGAAPWISRNRRLMRDFDRYTRTVAAFVRLAMVRIMLKRFTRSTQCSRT